jgi:hypothetical protein
MCVRAHGFLAPFKRNGRRFKTPGGPRGARGLHLALTDRSQKPNLVEIYLLFGSSGLLCHKFGNVGRPFALRHGRSFEHNCFTFVGREKKEVCETKMLGEWAALREHRQTDCDGGVCATQAKARARHGGNSPEQGDQMPPIFQFEANLEPLPFFLITNKSSKAWHVNWCNSISIFFLKTLLSDLGDLWRTFGFF